MRVWSSVLVSSLACACTIVIGDIPEGSDPVAAGGAGGAAGVGGTAFDGSGGTVEDAGPEAESDVATESAAGSGGSGGVDAEPDAPPDSACVVACDCDGDGEQSELSPCTGMDCDDADPDVFSTQTKYFGTPRSNGSFDYDCDGKETANHDPAQCAGTACLTNDPGLFGPPMCGTDQQWGVCTAGTLGCSVTPTSTKVPVLCR